MQQLGALDTDGEAMLLAGVAYYRGEYRIKVNKPLACELFKKAAILYKYKEAQVFYDKSIPECNLLGVLNPQEVFHEK